VDAESVMETLLLHPRETRLAKQRVSMICGGFDADVVRVMLSQEDGIKITKDMVRKYPCERERQRSYDSTA
jgi:hypothetical protein